MEMFTMGFFCFWP